jgi:hypothetical protein
MDAHIETTLSSLHSRHIRGIYAENGDVARREIVSLLPPGAVIGIGDSTAVRQLHLVDLLNEKGFTVLNGFAARPPGMSTKDFQENQHRIFKEATVCDVFLTGTNAVTTDGRLVNVDATGNRVAGMFWGHPISIVVVGRNKIVKDLEDAFHRIRKIISPTHFHVRAVALGGRKRKTPCVETGQCNDCRSPERGCNIFTIIEGKPARTNLNVIIVNEDLGLGWDPSWPEPRVHQILENYKKYAWVPSPD